jgi:hypothetical protein
MHNLLQAPLVGAAFGMAIMMIIVIAAVSLLISILIIVAQWFIYSKAGQPGWAAIVPFYNMIVLLKIVGRPAWWICWFLQIILFDLIFIMNQGLTTMLLLMLSGITAMVFSVIITNSLSKSFGKDAGFTVGLIFLPYVFYPILGFGKATYIGPGGKPAADSPQV